MPNLWSFDRRGRWRSREWRRWVTQLPCSCGRADCSNCGPGMAWPVEPAHLRYGSATGLGMKPDDFLTYPLGAGQHRSFHNGGQPTQADQFAWVIETWRRAHQEGVLLVAERVGPLFATASEDVDRSWNWRIQTTARLWRRAFACGALQLKGTRL